MDELIKLDTVNDYARLFGLQALHPLVTVIDMSVLKSYRNCRLNMGFYAVFFKELGEGSLSYGRNRYDYQDSTLVFMAPGQVVGIDDGGKPLKPKGLALVFHPDLLHGTSLAAKMKEYTFFSYSSNEALHMSERERQIVLTCFSEIRNELEQNIDKHTKSIVTSTIETLLNYCVRFYDRQFVTREEVNKDLLSRFEQVLDNYFDSDNLRTLGLPTVPFCADKLHLSRNYFGDLIKKETGKTPLEYIQFKTIDRCKDLLVSTNKTVSEIAYEVGFKYPHHLSRMFKSLVGMTPNEYRQLA